MSKDKKVRYHSHWNRIACDKNEPYKLNYKLINLDITLESLVRLKEYNKSQFALWIVLMKNKRLSNRIVQLISEEYKDYYYTDFLNIHNNIEKLCEVGLKDEKNLADCKVFSGDNITREKHFNSIFNISVEKGVN